MSGPGTDSGQQAGRNAARLPLPPLRRGGMGAVPGFVMGPAAGPPPAAAARPPQKVQKLLLPRHVAGSPIASSHGRTLAPLTSPPSLPGPQLISTKPNGNFDDLLAIYNAQPRPVAAGQPDGPPAAASLPAASPMQRLPPAPTYAAMRPLASTLPARLPSPLQPGATVGLASPPGPGSSSSSSSTTTTYPPTPMTILPPDALFSGQARSLLASRLSSPPLSPAVPAASGGDGDDSAEVDSAFAGIPYEAFEAREDGPPLVSASTLRDLAALPLYHRIKMHNQFLRKTSKIGKALHYAVGSQLPVTAYYQRMLPPGVDDSTRPPVHVVPTPVLRPASKNVYPSITHIEGEDDPFVPGAGDAPPVISLPPKPSQAAKLGAQLVTLGGVNCLLPGGDFLSKAMSKERRSKSKEAKKEAKKREKEKRREKEKEEKRRREKEEKRKKKQEKKKKKEKEHRQRRKKKDGSDSDSGRGRSGGVLSLPADPADLVIALPSRQASVSAAKVKTRLEFAQPQLIHPHALELSLPGYDNDDVPALGSVEPSPPQSGRIRRSRSSPKRARADAKDANGPAKRGRPRKTADEEEEEEEEARWRKSQQRKQSNAADDSDGDGDDDYDENENDDDNDGQASEEEPKPARRQQRTAAGAGSTRTTSTSARSAAGGRSSASRTQASSAAERGMKIVDGVRRSTRPRNPVLYIDPSTSSDFEELALAPAPQPVTSRGRGGRSKKSLSTSSSSDDGEHFLKLPPRGGGNDDHTSSETEDSDADQSDTTADSSDDDDDDDVLREVGIRIVDMTPEEARKNRRRGR